MNCSASIVYNNSWLSQTSDLAATALFTPSGLGVFRVTASVHLVTNSGSTNLELTETVTWGQPGSTSGSQQIILNASGSSSSNQCGSGTQSALADASRPFSISTTIYPTETLNYYDLYVTVEQLA